MSEVFEGSCFCHNLLKLPVTCHSMIGDCTRKLVSFTQTLVCVIYIFSDIYYVSSL